MQKCRDAQRWGRDPGLGWDRWQSATRTGGFEFQSLILLICKMELIIPTT